jgi:hypothetical protein
MVTGTCCLFTTGCIFTQNLWHNATVPPETNRSSADARQVPRDDQPDVAKPQIAERRTPILGAILLTPLTIGCDTLNILTLGMFWWTDGFGLGVTSNSPGLY